VARVRRDGTELNEALTSVPTDNLLGADGTYLYYLNETPSFFIGRMLRDGTAHEDEWLDTEGTDAIGDVVITATHIYWTNLEGERIGRAKIDGTEIEPAWLAAEGKPIGLATDGTYLYWGHRAGEGEYMARVKLDGSGLDTTFAKTGSLFKIAVGTYHLFWAPYGSEGVGRCTIDGGDIEPAWIPPAGSEAGGVAIDSEFFYWAQESEPGFIGRMSRAEADPPVEPEPGEGERAGPGSPFTYPAWDLLDMEPLDPLPYVGVSFGEEVNRPGPWQGRLPIGDPRVQELDYLRSSETGRTALFVDFNGVLVWGGIIWTRRYKESQQALVIGAMEFGSYFAQRLQAEDYAQTWEGAEHSEDPMLIAKRIVEDAQNRPPEEDVAPAKIGGGITVVINGGPAPTIQASYPGTQLQTVESIVSTLSQMGYTQGFDYTFDVAYLPGTKTPGITLNLWYPRKGRTAADSRLVLLAKDCTYTYPVRGSQQATSITETGSGVGTMTPVTASETLADYPLLQSTFARSQVNDDGTLAAVTANDLGLYVWPVVTPTFTVPVTLPDPVSGQVPPTAPLQLGTFDRGDNFIFRVDPVAGAGENADPRFPLGCRFEWRINSWQCTVADKGLSQIVINAGIPPLATIPPPQPPL
jgi:hypothetical protein